jgi:hypothetical protein
LTKRISITTTDDDIRSRRTCVDGTPVEDGYPLRWTDLEGMPFPAVYVRDVRQYDVEIWVNGTCIHRVPPREPLAEAIYQMIEDARAGRLDRPTVDEEPDFSRLSDIREEIRIHPGQIIHLRWMGLRRMLDVHDRNARELGGLLDAVASSDEIAVEMFQNTRPPDVREEIEARIDQRLHNYVASSGALVDHTRRMLAKYEGTALSDEYEIRKEEIARTGPARFMKDLRNYTLHRELPFLGNIVSLATDEGDRWVAEIRLSAALLLEWDGWSRPARSLIEASDGAITLRHVVREHVDLIRSLYQWLWTQYRGLHRYELVLLDDLHAEHDWVLSGGREGYPRRFVVEASPLKR